LRFTSLVHAMATQVDRDVLVECASGLKMLCTVNSPLHDEDDDGLYSSCLCHVRVIVCDHEDAAIKPGDWIVISTKDPPKRILSSDGTEIWRSDNDTSLLL
jgi:hypothetical protein